MLEEKGRVILSEAKGRKDGEESDVGFGCFVLDGMSMSERLQGPLSIV